MIWQNSHLRFTDALTFILLSPVLSSLKSLNFQQLVSLLPCRYAVFADTKKERNHPFPSEVVGTKGDAVQTKLVIVFRKRPDRVRAVE